MGAVAPKPKGGDRILGQLPFLMMLWSKISPRFLLAAGRAGQELHGRVLPHPLHQQWHHPSRPGEVLRQHLDPAVVQGRAAARFPGHHLGARASDVPGAALFERTQVGIQRNPTFQVLGGGIASRGQAREGRAGTVVASSPPSIPAQHHDQDLHR
eukprot:2947808-Pyramimonas_sp.AAC.1